MIKILDTVICCGSNGGAGGRGGTDRWMRRALAAARRMARARRLARGQ